MAEAFIALRIKSSAFKCVQFHLAFESVQQGCLTAASALHLFYATGKHQLRHRRQILIKRYLLEDLRCVAQKYLLWLPCS